MSAGARARFGDLTGDDVAALDDAAGRLGVDVVQLMEVAGWQVARCAWTMLSRRPGRVVVVAGRGNNGGDGLVVARHLQTWGCSVTVVVLGDETALRGVLPRQVAAARGSGIDVRASGSATGLAAMVADARLVVDAVLGTGLRSEPRDPDAAAIASMGAARVLSIDVPSGLDATTGEPFSTCVRAQVTCTLTAMKRGLWLPASAPHRGRVVAADIGMPAAAWAACGLAMPSALRGGAILPVPAGTP